MLHKTNDTLLSLGLLVLRVGAAALLICGHGWPKLSHFAARSATFADPLHVGHSMSLGLVLFAEVACSFLVLIGLATRAALVPILIFFGVAIFVQHGGAPFVQKELALVYALPFLALLVMGPGRFSLDEAGSGGGGSRSRR
jgi:putative oxidoreductase